MEALNKKIVSVALVLSSLVIFTGCKTDDSGKFSFHAEKTGSIYYGYTFQEDSIMVTTTHMLVSDWDTEGFDYLCSDASCQHDSEDCSAYISEDINAGANLALVYGDKTIIFQSYTESTNGQEDEDTIWNHKYYTNIYEADLLGENRTLKKTIEGGLMENCIPRDSIICGQYLILGLSKSLKQTDSYTEVDGELVTETSYEYSEEVLAIDLESFDTYSLIEKSDMDCVGSSTTQFYLSGEYLYCVMCDSMNELNEAEDGFQNYYSLYCMKEGESSFTLLTQYKEDESVTRSFVGAIGETYFYETDNEIHKVTDGEDTIFYSSEEACSAGIYDDYIVISDQYTCDDTGLYNGMTCEWYNVSGELLDTYTYDSYFCFMEDLNDRLIICYPFEEKQEWWISKDEIRSDLSSAVYIGPFVGLMVE